jgi:monoamine oxidase
LASSNKIVIVGAGVSGLYAAWRLCIDTQTVDPNDIIILEQSNRTGGRLYTQTLNQIDPALPSDSSVRAELGGMRILNYNLYTYSLALHLGLELVSFPADVNENWHFLRGQVFQSSGYPTQTAYPLASQEKGWVPGDVIYNSLVTNSQIVPEEVFPSQTNTQRSFVNWVMQNCRVNDQPSYFYGFWNALVGSGLYQSPSASNVSYQAYAYFLEAGAYDTIPSNWNASVAFSNALSDFSNKPTYWAISDGYEQLPNKLRDLLLGQNPQMIVYESEVTSILRLDSSNYTVTAKDPSGNSHQYPASKVILAIPPRALEKLPKSVGEALSNQQTALLQSTPVPLVKLFLVYDTPWWSGAVPKEQWPLFTRMTTDLPMRQIYNFGSTTESGGKTYYLLQASYSDGLKAGYWSGLLPAEANTVGQDVDTTIFGRIINNSGETTISTGMLSFGTAQEVSAYPIFSTVHEQFVTLVQSIAAAQPGTTPSVSPVNPIAGVAMDWATDPFGGGVNFWNVGVDVNSAYWSMMNPKEGDHLYIIGEGYSLYQGWVEGALWSAEDMLNKFFGLTPPKAPDAGGWLYTTPYQGAQGHVPANAARK